MDRDELLAKSGNPPIRLEDHLQEVADYARQVAQAYWPHWENLLGPELASKVFQALVLAALTHDLGKIAEGFQLALRNKRHRWEFRHEVLSAAILLAGEFPDREVWELAVAAVLTHHRDLDDGSLGRNAGLLPLPIPEIVEEATRRFAARAQEMRAGWRWLERFRAQHPELAEWRPPQEPDGLSPPTAFFQQLKEKAAAMRVPENLEGTALILVRGWLMAADHAVSAGVKVFKTCLPPLPSSSLRAFQKELGEHIGHAFLEAPTGSGKTLAAIRWALSNRMGGERIFYILPYQASIEAMEDTLAGSLLKTSLGYGEQRWGFGRENVAALHARALDYVFREHFERLGEYEAAASYAKAEAELNRLAHKPIKVATPFQLLKWFFGIPRWELGVSEMIGGLYIFDEIHAYDAHVVALILQMVRVLRRLGGRFLFMSATFPPFLKELLQEALGEKTNAFTLEPYDDWSVRFLSQARHRLRWRNGRLEDLLPEILRAIREGQRVLIVANRVAQAQAIYQELKKQADGVYLLHSRLARRDRLKREQKVIKSLRGETEMLVRALVATQVVEVSLDVSFDTLFTEVAPVDDLLQRFGRVNRYGEHPDGVEVHVARQFEGDRLKFVYDLERIEATIDRAPMDGTLLTVPIAADWVHKVYQEGWTDRERQRFEQAETAFSQLLKDIRPLRHLDEGREEFNGLFQSVEVLPSPLFEEYVEHQNAKRHLLAHQLFVPIPLGAFHKLRKAKRLSRLADGTWLADAAYDAKLGLHSGDANFDNFF